MNDPPADAGHNEQEALQPKEWFNWFIAWLGVILSKRWPQTLQRLQGLTSRSLPQLPAKTSTDQILARDPWHMDTPLFMLSPEDAYTIGHSFEGTFVMGGTGAGKSSTSLAITAKACLRQGYGALILTSPPDEIGDWERWASETGRADDLLIIRPDGPHSQFNFLDHEARQGGEDGSFLSENLVVLLTQINELVRGFKKEQGGGSSDFFSDAMKELLRATVTALLIGGEEISLDNIRQLIASAPQEEDELQYEEWREESYCARVLWAGFAREDKSAQETHDFEMAYRYWSQEHVRLADRTKTSITATVHRFD